MLPLQQAYEVRSAVLEYIKATFHFKDNEVGKAFYQFIEDSRNGLFKGPYVSLKTPFVKAKKMSRFPWISVRRSLLTCTRYRLSAV